MDLVVVPSASAPPAPKDAAPGTVSSPAPAPGPRQVVDANGYFLLRVEPAQMRSTRKALGWFPWTSLTASIRRVEGHDHTTLVLEDGPSLETLRQVAEEVGGAREHRRGDGVVVLSTKRGSAARYPSGLVIVALGHDVEEVLNGLPGRVPGPYDDLMASTGFWASPLAIASTYEPRRHRRGDDCPAVDEIGARAIVGAVDPGELPDVLRLRAALTVASRPHVDRILKRMRTPPLPREFAGAPDIDDQGAVVRGSIVAADAVRDRLGGKLLDNSLECLGRDAGRFYKLLSQVARGTKQDEAGR